MSEPAGATASNPAGWDLPVGPELLARLEALDAAGLSGMELPEALAAAYRLSGHVQALVLGLVAEQARRETWEPDPRDPDRVQRREEVTDSGCAEIACALKLTAAGTERLVDLAIGLERLPATRAALSAGVVDDYKARIIYETTGPITEPDVLTQVEAQILQRACDQTSGQLRTSANKIIMRADPQAAANRHEQRKKDRRVELYPGADGTAGLAGCDLPADQASAAWQHLCATARASLTRDDPRSMDQARADAYLALLTGVTPAPGTDDGIPIKGRPVGKVTLTVPLTTLMGLTDEPGELSGFGPIIADLARQLAHTATSPDTPWCFTVTDEAGRMIHHGRTHYRPTPNLREWITARDTRCVFPTCRQPSPASGGTPNTCDLDHTTKYADGGDSCPCNMAPLCRKHHALKDHARWTLTRSQTGQYVWTTPTGHTYTNNPDP